MKFSLVVLLFTNLCFGQLNKVAFEQIEALQQSEKRNIVVFIHADWCKFCHRTENTTLQDSTVINLLNNRFYYIDFNAEEKRIIRFNNTYFAYKPSGTNTGIHELAEALATLKGKVSYPSICVLNPQYEIIFQYNQFLNATNCIEVLKRLN